MKLKTIWKVVIGVLIGVLLILGLGFVFLLLIPDDNSSSVEAVQATKQSAVEETVSVDNGQTGSTDEKNSNSEDIKGTTQTDLEYNDAGTVTVLVYMNGSDLESQGAEATTDISEMLKAGVGDKVNVIIQTMGTKEWHDYDISSKTSQIYRVNGNKLELIEADLGQLDCTAPGTLSDFIGYGKSHYPADRYMLVFWDHGAGPVYGFGYDEWNDDPEAALTLNEMTEAFSNNKDVKFDIIGMDCCIMSNLETCYALAPFCRYSILSEDFQSAIGWDYMTWLKELEKHPNITSPVLGKKIIDSIINANETDEYGDTTTIAMINEAAVPDLYKAWTAYAYANESKLLGTNYSKKHRAKGRSSIFDSLTEWAQDMSEVTLADYYISDMLALIESVGVEDEKTDTLRSALKKCMAYFGHTSDANELTGLSVSLPYGDDDLYSRIRDIYSKCGFDKEYIDWLGKFVKAQGGDSYQDYEDFEQNWGGWASYEEYTSGANSAGSVPLETGQGSGSNHGPHDGGGHHGNDSGSGANQDQSYSGGYSSEDGEWVYDYRDRLWYMESGGVLYVYDDETETIYYYDEAEDIYYYYDEYDDEWYPAE
ncbi:MAG: hypothetical protein K6G03_04120 [Lachnospiraceae bacterium]|nr:hypothetical protein [Lachnospiraceae bacterium]